MSVGFTRHHQAGPGNDTKVGYRSEFWLNFGLPGNELSYNGFEFPPALSSKVSIVPEYDKSERIVKWLDIIIQVEFIFTEYQTTPATAGTKGTYGQITYGSSRELIRRLSQVGQALRFDAQGFGGYLRINDPTDPSGRGIVDIDNGPRPRMLDMQPLGGGNAFLVSWSVNTRISPLEDVYLGPFVAFNYSADIKWQPDGYFTRVISGIFELPSVQKTVEAFSGSDKPQPDHYNFKGFYGKDGNNLLEAKKYLNNLFPEDPAYSREIQFSWDETHKNFKFSIEDTIRKTGSWYPPGVGDFTLNQRLYSGLGKEQGGFRIWALTYSGTITAAKNSEYGLAASKKLAWYWLWKILTWERKQFYTTANLWVQANDPTSRGITETFEESVERLSTDYLMMPIAIEFVDQKYGNQIDFTISYKVICTTSILYRALNVFNPVQEALQEGGLDRNSYILYKQRDNVHPSASGLGIGNLPAVGFTEILFDVATPIDPPPTEPGETPERITESSSGIEQEAASLLAASRPKTGRDWETYEVKFCFMEDTKNIVSSTLAPTGAIRSREIINSGDKAAPKATELAHAPYSGNNSEIISENIPYTGTTVITPSERTRYVIMEGYATRYSGPIAPPRLIAVGDALAYQDNTLGMDEVEIEVVPLEMKDEEGKLVEQYVCRWRKHYVLDRIPTTYKINTTAIPRRFV